MIAVKVFISNIKVDQFTAIDFVDKIRYFFRLQEAKADRTDKDVIESVSITMQGLRHAWNGSVPHEIVFGSHATRFIHGDVDNRTSIGGFRRWSSIVVEVFLCRSRSHQKD